MARVPARPEPLTRQPGPVRLRVGGGAAGPLFPAAPGARSLAPASAGAAPRVLPTGIHSRAPVSPTPPVAPGSDFPLRIPQPALRAFAAAGYTRLQDFTRASEAELLQLHGVGPKAVRLLRDALAARGLAFAG